MTKANIKYRRIIIISLVALVALLFVMSPRHTLSHSIKLYALRHAYAPNRGADAYYENYRVINVRIFEKGGDGLVAAETPPNIK